MLLILNLTVIAIEITSTSRDSSRSAPLTYTTPNNGAEFYMCDLVEETEAYSGITPDPDKPYIYYVHVNIVIAENDTLIIQNGEEIRFDPGIDLGLFVDGTLIAEGSSMETYYRITFTSNSQAPERGDWHGIVFRNTSVDSKCILRYCRIEYAEVGITCMAAEPRIADTVITKTTKAMIVEHTPSLILDNCTITDSWLIDFDLRYTGVTLLNTVRYGEVIIRDDYSNLTTKWYLDVYVRDQYGGVPGALVEIRDNPNGTYVANYTTDDYGWVRWIQCTESILTKPYGEVKYTPYNISVHAVGYYDAYAVPEVFISSSMIEPNHITIALEVMPGALAYLSIWADDKYWSTEIDAYVIDALSTLQFYAAGYDNMSNEVTINVSWSVAGKATITDNGLFVPEPAGYGYCIVYGNQSGISGNATVLVCPSPPVSIKIEPALWTMTTADTVQFYVVGYDTAGNQWLFADYGYEVEWSVSGGGTIDATGKFTPELVGEWVVTANYRELLIATAKVIVKPGAVVNIDIIASAYRLTTDEEITLNATATDAKGQLVPVEFEWYATGGGTLFPDEAGVRYVASQVGNWTIYANASGLSANVTITITAGKLYRIVIYPALEPVVLSAGDTHQFTAIGLDRDNNPVTILPTWSVTGGGMISTTGLFTGQRTGSWTIYATVTLADETGSSRTIVGMRNITITHGKLDYILVIPFNSIITLSDILNLSVEGYDKFDNRVPLTATEVVWDISGGGTIDATGTFMPEALGTWTIYANYTGALVYPGAIIGSAFVTVTAIPQLAVERPKWDTVVNGMVPIEVSILGYVEKVEITIYNALREEVLSRTVFRDNNSMDPTPIKIFIWNSTSYPNGMYMISIRAYYINGEVITQTVKIYVENPRAHPSVIGALLLITFLPLFVGLAVRSADRLQERRQAATGYEGRRTIDLGEELFGIRSNLLVLILCVFALITAYVFAYTVTTLSPEAPIPKPLKFSLTIAREVLPWVAIAFIPIIAALSIVTTLSARILGLWAEFRTWISGAIALFISTFIFLIPFGYIEKTTLISGKGGDVPHSAKGLVAISKLLACLLLLLPFGLLIEFDHMFITILSEPNLHKLCTYGILGAVMIAWFSVFPFKPFEGQKIFEWNKPIWLGLFIVTFILFYSANLILLPMYVYLYVGLGAVVCLAGIFAYEIKSPQLAELRAIKLPGIRPPKSLRRKRREKEEKEEEVARLWLRGIEREEEAVMAAEEKEEARKERRRGFWRLFGKKRGGEEAEGREELIEGEGPEAEESEELSFLRELERAAAEGEEAGLEEGEAKEPGEDMLEDLGTAEELATFGAPELPADIAELENKLSRLEAFIETTRADMDEVIKLSSQSTENIQRLVKIYDAVSKQLGLIRTPDGRYELPAGKAVKPKPFARKTWAIVSSPRKLLLREINRKLAELERERRAYLTRLTALRTTPVGSPTTVHHRARGIREKVPAEDKVDKQAPSPPPSPEPILTKLDFGRIPEQRDIIERWLEHITKKVPWSKIPDLLDRYVHIGWLSDKARAAILKYINSISDKYSTQARETKLTLDDHIKSLMFIMNLAGRNVTQAQVEAIEREIRMLKEGGGLV